MASDSAISFFDHSRHRLKVRTVDIALDVLAFRGEEGLSKPFVYRIEFTSTEQDIAAHLMLGQEGSFSLHAALNGQLLQLAGGESVKPLRSVYGVVTGFKRLAGSNDQAIYEVLLEPRLALLGRGQQYRIFQQQSVPEIVESILRDHHAFRGQDLYFALHRDYPKRDQVMQYGESDLAFITRLLAEVGIWYRFASDDRLGIEVVEFHDDQRAYQFGIELPYRSPSGTTSSGQDGIWQLQSEHQVVERQVSLRSYTALDATADLDGKIASDPNVKTVYGDAYRFGEPYRAMGDALAERENLDSESGYFFARLRHERYLNLQTRLTGISSSASLAPGQVLKVGDGAPQAFSAGAVLTELVTTAARDRSLTVEFKGIPFSQDYCFRPALAEKPQIAGTVPARITSRKNNDPYSHINLEGRYKVSFLFDRGTWPAGGESLWLRLARPYAGAAHGLHLPLLAGTEVAVAFEQGDPDRPYIAHALHDSEHADHVTLRNHKRNVLRTPANNKLRLDDSRGEEHIKLSTEHSGKSQLNLGHLVDSGRQKRGEGFELRTDGWGAIRAGRGLFISTDEQLVAGGPVLAMQAATAMFEGAEQQLLHCQKVAAAHNCVQPSLDDLQQLHADAKGLKGPAIVLSAPQGISAVTPASLLLKSGGALYLQSGDEINLAAAQRLNVHAGQAISLVAQQEGMRLVSGDGPLAMASHNGLLDIIAKHDLTVQTTDGHIQLTAKNGITLGCGGGFIRITAQGEIELYSTGKLTLKGQHHFHTPAGQEFPLPVLPAFVCEDCLRKAAAASVGFLTRGQQP